MTTLNKIWIWFNGKKTIIGAVCFVISFVLTTFVGGLGATVMSYLYKAETVLSNVGAVMSVVGLIHKWIKYKIAKAKVSITTEIKTIETKI